MALEIKQCIFTKNDCYKQGKKITPTGIVVHSTGANNPNLKRYVQPDDGILGDNQYDNDWNKSGIEKCVHAFIGKDKNGVVRVYQTLPWDYRCWGCGSGTKGSYNNNFIQFEICEDALTDSTYFNAAFNLAMELCAYLAKTYNISTKNIVSHCEAHKLGYASNHSDCDYWLKKFSKTMDWFRSGVDNLLKPVATVKPTTTPTVSASAKKPDIIYAVKAGGKWYPEVKNNTDYAGVENKQITDVMIKLSDGTPIKYRVHIKGGNWLPYVTGYNKNDHNNGYAGNGKVIDAIEIKCDKYEIGYKVSTTANGTSYYSEVKDSKNDYAGVFGKPVDKLMCRVL